MASLQHRFTPFLIDKDNPHHNQDVEQQIRHLLQQRGVQPVEAFEEAVKLLLDNSEGTFVYVARVGDMFDSDGRDGAPLTMEQVREVPKGLYGTFMSYFDKVWRQLDQGAEAGSAAGFKGRLLQLLGLLAVACEPPRVEQLAVWMGGEAGRTEEVETLLSALGTLFSVREEDNCVYGFHKSIYDWLRDQEVGMTHA
jgi:hypothetical protein